MQTPTSVGPVTAVPGAVPRVARRRARVMPSPREIPYDYVAVFDLIGQRGNRVEQVISISVEGAFVVTAIGYSFIAAPLPPEGPDGMTETERMLLRCLLTQACGVDFLYSIVDSATGRELQNRSIHNIAGLGDPFGNRPFLPMPKPMLFLPRSTIRVVLEEVSEGPIYGYEADNGQRVTSQVFIDLKGYKILGQAP